MFEITILTQSIFSIFWYTLKLIKDGSDDWKCLEVKVSSSIDPSGKTSESGVFISRPWEAVFIFDQKIGLKPVESKNKPLFKFIE